MSGSDDRGAIMNLLARYNHTFDRGDPQAWADCFVPDGVFRSASAEARGRDALVAFAEARRGGTTRHWTDNHLIEVRGDTATMACYLMLVRSGKGDERPQVTFQGNYTDELVRTPDGWRFRSRTVTRGWS
jgi:uncharacterized protein (TIGR02246 family)